MSDLNVAATSTTPGISACSETGRVSLIGDSYPENSFEFFQPLIAWLESYLGQPEGRLSLEICLAYLNTSSVRVMMDILDMLEESFQAGRQVDLVWFYEAGNERIAELAEEFREDCTFPYTVTPRGT